MTENVLTLLPPRLRKGLYILYGLTGLAASGALAYYGAIPELTVPKQIYGVLAVLGSLSTAFSVIAASNVKPPTPPTVQLPEVDGQYHGDDDYGNPDVRAA